MQLEPPDRDDRGTAALILVDADSHRWPQAGIPFRAAIAGVAIERDGLIRTIAAVGAVYVVVIALMFFNPATDERTNGRPQAAGSRRADARVSVSAGAPLRSATMKAGLS